MGSSGSKASSSSSRGRCDDRIHHRSKGKSRVFQSSCLGASSGSHDDNVDSNANQVYEPCDKDNDDCTSFTEQNETESEQVKINYSGKGDVDSSARRCCVSSNSGLEDWDSSVMAANSSRAGSSTIRGSLPQSLNPSSRFLSRFSFIPGNVSFRLSRASSLGSSRNLTVVDNDDDLHLMQPQSNGLADIIESRQGCTALASLRNPVQHDEDISDNRWSASQASHSSFTQESNPYVSSTHDVRRDGHSSGSGVDMNLHSPRMHPEPGYNEMGLTERRAGGREPVERNVRFSRTLSVGRLRDRVLRRSSLSELTFCPLQRETGMRDEGEIDERQASTVETGLLTSESNAISSSPTSGYSPSGMSRSTFGIQDHDMETSRTREARYRDLLEHRSDFLERRRRIRSQVRALQRLGSRFENLSGHERSCILSGQHRTGRCTCRNSNHDTNSNDDSNARASISRIVMLAEALFEVLDEIHQQSVVLSSRPSVSSIGSVPAPNEVVDSLPVKLYSKLQKQQNEDAAQCYICLVEYEDGDSVRVLPCHHEFHKTCIDKWLKEIHRVCPLCRGDICRSDSFSTEHEANNFAI